MQLKEAAVLIVEDEPILREIIGEWFARMAGRVLTAGNGAEALEVLAENPVQLAEQFRPDAMQVPFSLLDQRLLRDGSLSRLKELGVEIHARSIFLQGLLFLENPPAKLADAGQDTVELPEDQDWTAYARGLPTGGGFQIGQDFIEPPLEIRHDVVPIQADSMPGMERRGSPAHQHRARHQGLEVSLGCQQVFPARMGLSGHAPRIAQTLASPPALLPLLGLRRLFA